MYQFNENSTVCFVGDSVTFRGRWIRRIYDYYRNIIGIKCEMYNCGVPGDRAVTLIERLEETILLHNPTDVVIMYGLNDVESQLYIPGTEDEETLSKRKNCIERCISILDDISAMLKSRGIRIIYCTPTPYDELNNTTSTVCRKGTYAAMGEISNGIRQLCNTYGEGLVDFYSVLSRIMEEKHRSGEHIIEPDRVHPIDETQELMAQLFLKAQGFEVNIETDIQRLRAVLKSGYDKWETGRFELEEKAKKNDLIRWAVFSPEKTEKALLEKSSQYLCTDNTDAYIADCARLFIKTYMNDEAYMQKLIEHTKTVYSAV